MHELEALGREGCWLADGLIVVMAWGATPSDRFVIVIEQCSDDSFYAFFSRGTIIDSFIPIYIPVSSLYLYNGLWRWTLCHGRVEIRKRLKCVL